MTIQESPTVSLPEGEPLDFPFKHTVQLTQAAVDKSLALLQQEGRTDLRLRVMVQPGGCSGLIYNLSFDDRLADYDAVTDFDGLEVIVDKTSIPYLDKAVVDFVDTIAKQGFIIENPTALGLLTVGIFLY